MTVIGKNFFIFYFTNYILQVDSYGSIIESARKHFEPECRDDVFDINYTSKDGTRDVAFKLKGVKRELGQTLYSTGLTM